MAKNLPASVGDTSLILQFGCIKGKTIVIHLTNTEHFMFSIIIDFNDMETIYSRTSIPRILFVVK